MKLIAFIFFSFISLLVNAQSEYTTSVVFPANYQVGDYIEFVNVAPIAAGASGNFEISIAYTRGNMAAASTHLASVSHFNPSVWREAGKVNGNPYVSSGAYNFTIDVNGEYGNVRFRIRAIATLGVLSENITVYIKVRSINENASWSALNNTGNDVAVNKFVPMTDEWSLYVGNAFTTNSAALAIKAVSNGNVGIGTATPAEKLSVNGKIRAKEIKVETANWPDFVFDSSYKNSSLSDLEKYIEQNKHLPDVPSTKEVLKNGIELGEMNKILLQKIEELTLHLIEKDKQLTKESIELKKQHDRIAVLEELIKKIIKE